MEFGSEVDEAEGLSSTFEMGKGRASNLHLQLEARWYDAWLRFSNVKWLHCKRRCSVILALGRTLK